MVFIPNTLELTTLWVSRPLAAEVAAHPDLRQDGDFLEMPLDDAGNLIQEILFPDSIRGRRSRTAAANRKGREPR